MRYSKFKCDLLWKLKLFSQLPSHDPFSMAYFKLSTSLKPLSSKRWRHLGTLAMAWWMIAIINKINCFEIEGFPVVFNSYQSEQKFKALSTRCLKVYSNQYFVWYLFACPLMGRLKLIMNIIKFILDTNRNKLINRSDPLTLIVCNWELKAQNRLTRWFYRRMIVIGLSS